MVSRTQIKDNGKEKTTKNFSPVIMTPHHQTPDGADGGAIQKTLRAMITPSASRTPRWAKTETLTDVDDDDDGNGRAIGVTDADAGAVDERAVVDEKLKLKRSDSNQKQ